MRKKLLVVALAAAGIFSGAVAQAEDSPFMVRVRGVYLNWENGQSGGLPLASGKIEASKQWIPEIDFSYFFTKNIAAELVLTWPQDVKINLDGNQIGTIKALPPSLVLQYHFTDLGKFKPYVGLGINYTIFTQRDNILNGAAQVDSSSVGVVAQVGMDEAVLLCQSGRPVKADVHFARRQVRELRPQRAHGPLQRKALAHPVQGGLVCGHGVSCLLFTLTLTSTAL